MYTTQHHSSARVASWHQLYQAALFETDRRELPRRITAAESAITQRAQELFNSSADNIEEDEALDDAMYALQALQNSLAYEKQAA
jgi:hypothetical protein